MQALLLILLILCAKFNDCCSRQLENSQILSQRKCPLWFQYNKTLHSCQCPRQLQGALHERLLTCKGKDVIEIFRSYIATYDENKKIITVSPNYCNKTLITEFPADEYVSLPSNLKLSRLNEYMCGPLNRKGYLCKDCVNGYGLAVNTLMTCLNKCYNCTAKTLVKQIILYVIIEFVLPLLFYIFILIFQISFTSAPMTCFILYSQLVVFVFYYLRDERLPLLVMYTELGELRLISKFIFALYGIFNLDFFCHALPPLCISTHLKPIHRNLLGYISALYPLVLIFLTWLCIKLHDNNFKPFVVLWRPFHRCFFQLRKGWNTRNDLIDVFASYFLLSYCKIMYQFIIMVSTHRIFHYSPTEGYLSVAYVLATDNTVPISSLPFIVTATFMAIISVIFSLLPLLLLIYYPRKWFKNLISKCKLDGLALALFMEKYHSCYQDGLDGGKDMRSFAGLYFLLRMLEGGGVSIICPNLGFEWWFARGTLLSITAVAIALCRPYKKSYVNVVDTLLLSHMALICYILSSKRRNIQFVPFMQILILIPFTVFTVHILFRILRGVYKVCFKHFLFQNYYLKAESGVNSQQELNQSGIIYGAINS